VTGSTQDDARQHYSKGPVLVVADGQTAGRGRQGATWETAPAALAMSLAFEPGWPSETWPVMPLVAGVGASRVFGCDLKWPNDLLLDGAKVGGILVEAGMGPVVIGVGVNLWWPDAPAGYGSVLGGRPSPSEVERLARAWADEFLTELDNEPSSWPRSEYVSRCLTIGRHITWDPNGRGKAIEVAEDGALIVETDAGTEELRSGEVRHVRGI
jgi:BirA family biotin operon repressor/biotin-[acetyl-CoA-carboxylase] ligase